MEDDGPDRLEFMEQKLARMEAKEIETQTTLNQILSTIAAISQTLSQKPLEPASPVTPPVNNTTELSKPRTARPAAPPDFDGDRSKGRAFVNACRTYIRLCKKEFPDEQTKIIWAMSYMKTGRAEKWTSRVFRWEQQPENAGAQKFVDFQDFLDEFEKEFTPAHADAVAMNRLESAAYYQKTRSLDDYIDEFQDLVVEARYTDPKMAVLKFRRGLNPQTQNAVATMASGRPADDNLAEWYSCARTIDQNRAINEAFLSTGRSSVQPASRPIGTSFIRNPAPSAPFRHAHSTPSPGNPIPMDVDALKRKARSIPEGSCYRCGKLGHFGRDCPDRFDIRLMTADEVQDVLEGKLTQKDVEAANPPIVEDAEDFQNDDE